MKKVVYLSVEQGANNQKLLSLWDSDGPGRTAAEVTVLPSGRVEIGSRGAVEGALDL